MRDRSLYWRSKTSFGANSPLDVHHGNGSGHDVHARRSLARRWGAAGNSRAAGLTCRSASRLSNSAAKNHTGALPAVFLASTVLSEKVATGTLATAKAAER